MQINYSKLRVTWKNNLNNIYKENTIIGVGQEAVINFSSESISNIYVNFEVDGEVYTDLVQIERNIIHVPFKTDVLKKGTHKLEIVAYLKNGDVVPSPTFSYYVEDAIENPNGITAETNYPILIQLLEEIEEWNEDAKRKEIERQENENTRISNENTRVSNENTRKSNEDSRQQYETQRRVEEDERLTDEQVRVNAENIRIANENERLRKEIERQNAEELRQIAYNSSLYGRMDEAEDRLNEAESQLAQTTKNIDNAIYFVTPEMFGYVHGEDSTEALNKAISYCKTNGAKLICKDITLFSDIDFRRIKLEITGVLKLGIYNCKLGNNSAQPNAPEQFINSVSQDTEEYQLKILGAKGQRITILYCPKLKFELLPGNTTDSMAYSIFDIHRCPDIWIGNGDDTTTGTLWFNENTINLKRASKFKMTGSYQHNNNIINGGCFEGSACIELEKGTNNIFRDIRFEGSPTAIFHSGTSHNYIFNSWISYYRTNSVAITNYGVDNKVIYTQLEPRFINYNIDTQDYTDGHFTSVSYDEATDSLVVPAWKTYFKSPFMEFKSGATFHPKMLGGVMGRVRIRVFDENFIELTDIEDNCAILTGVGNMQPGEAIPQTSGWSSYTLELRTNPDERIKYIRYELYSASKLSFKKLNINITTGDLYYYV